MRYSRADSLDGTILETGHYCTAACDFRRLHRDVPEPLPVVICKIKSINKPPDNPIVDHKEDTQAARQKEGIICGKPSEKWIR